MQLIYDSLPTPIPLYQEHIVFWGRSPMCPPLPGNVSVKSYPFKKKKKFRLSRCFPPDENYFLL